MIQNRFVILWDNQPVGIDHSNGLPTKTNNPNMIHYFIDKVGAEHYVSIMSVKGKGEQYTSMVVKEIQFRIMDSK